MIGRGPWTRETCSCSFFRKIVYKYPFLQRSIEKWKIEARLCVTLVDLLFYASFSPVCLCLATIGFHSASRFLSSRFLFFRICFFFFLFFFIIWLSWEWSNEIVFHKVWCFRWIESNGRMDWWKLNFHVYRFI